MTRPRTIHRRPDLDGLSRRNVVNLDWRTYAFGSAAFAALTAIFGKVGVTELNSNLATFIRTLVILAVSALLITARGEWQRPDTLSSKGVVFLVLSGVATGLSWLCYFRALQLAPASRVAPLDKLSVALVIIFSIVFLGEPLTWQTAVGGSLIVGGVLLIALS